MMDAGELKFQQLSNRPEKKIGKKNLVIWPSRICLAQNVGGVEKSGNKFVFFSYVERCFIDTLKVL